MLYDNKVIYLNKEVGNTEKYDRSVKRTVLDKYVYEDVCEDSLPCDDMPLNRSDLIEGVQEDLFNYLYKVDPMIYHEDDLTVNAKVRDKIFKQMIELPELQVLRNKTVSNLFESALSIKSLHSIINNMATEVLQNNNSFKDVMNNLQHINKLEQELEDDSMLDEDREGVLKQISDLNKSVEDTLNEDDDLIGSFGASIKKGMEFVQSNMGEAISQIDSIKSFIKGFGNENSKAEKLPIKDKMEIADKLVECKRFKEVCEALGRMQEMINKLPKIPTDKGYEYADIGLGHSIPRVLSSEKVLLTDSSLEDSFFKKYSNKSLLEFKTKGYEEGKGPIIICLDESGSMRGKQDIWAKSFAMACIQLAYRQKRDCCVIPFSGYASKPFEFYYKDFDYKSMIECCSLFLGGGTNYEQPLCKAVEYIKKCKNFKKADILFITDGDADEISTKTRIDLDELKAKETKIQAVLIGDKVKDKTIKTFADSIVKIKNLDEDNVMIDVFDNIIK